VEPNGYLVLNWIVCAATLAGVAWASFPALLYLGLSLFMSQGFHPANARQLQRHYWDGSDAKAVNGQGGAAMTFSYYGWTNAFFLNVGYHNEHHDFVQVAWTRLPALRALVGDAYYPDSAAYQSRGFADLVNFVTNPALGLANFYSAERAPEREEGHRACLTRDAAAAAVKAVAADAARAAKPAVDTHAAREVSEEDPAGDGRAVHLGNRRLGALPQRHEVLGVALHVGVVDHRVPGGSLLLPGVVNLPLAKLRQVVATAKSFARTFHHNHMDVRVGVGPIDRCLELARCFIVDGVESFGSVVSHVGDGAPRFGFAGCRQKDGRRASSQVGNEIAHCVGNTRSQLGVT
jgi:hypothetical protein